MFKKDSSQQYANEVDVRYKNVDYADNNTSIQTIPSPLTSDYLNSSYQTGGNVPEQPRPISCPVCLKIIAMNSILTHFHFDHAKVLKFRLTNSKRKHIIIKATELSFETKCIAVFLLGGDNMSRDNINPIQIPSSKIRPCLLLGTKIRTEPLRNNTNNVNKIIDDNDKKSQSINRRFDENVILIFWICKTDNNELVSHIKLSRKEKNMSFGYTGDAIHIREKQDGRNIYRHAECLIIRGKAANNLLDEGDQLHVFFKCLL